MNDADKFQASDRPSVSVVVPSFNPGGYLALCLEALSASTYPFAECIVVDDASTDGALEQAALRYDIKTLKLERQCGAAFARNWGVHHARGEIIFFADSDVALHPDAIEKAVEAFEQDPSLAAVFGSYDDSPGHPSFLSQYRNLMHHWVHQNGSEEAESFWTGCGAIRREVFVSSGGFDRRTVAIEDIEFGHKLSRSGHRIRLHRDMMGKHLKHWSLLSILKTDLWSRAVPWIALMHRERDSFDNLNVNTASKFATVMTGLLLMSVLGLALAGRWAALLPFAALVITAALSSFLGEARGVHGWRSYLSLLLVGGGTIAALIWASDFWGLLPIALCGLVVGSQWRFFKFLNSIRGSGYCCAAIPMQLLFFTICGVSVPLGICQARLGFMVKRVDPAQFPDAADDLFGRKTAPSESRSQPPDPGETT